MRKNCMWLRALAATLMLSSCLASFAACQAPSDDTPGTEDTTQAGDTTAAIETITEAATEAPTEPATEPATEPETEAPFVGQTFDATTRIVIPADADEITRNPADMVAAAISEQAGMTLTVTAEATDGPALILGIRVFETERSYALSADGQTLRLEASDSTTLYFAAEAVLEAWLTPDFGLRTEGVLSLADDRVAELNGLTTRQDLSIKILTQNVRCASDPDGNSIGKRNTRFHQLLIEYRPDLIGAQEVTREWVQNFRRMDSAMEKLGADMPEYGIVTCFREGPEATDGEAQTILYSLDRFEHLDSGVIWLTDTPDVPSQLEDSSYNCVLTWVYLMDKQTGEKILYGNTHLEYRFAKEHIRNAQMGYILDFLEQYRDECTVYVSGDFNFKPDSAPYQMATEVLMDSHDSAWENLSSVDYTYHDYEREPEKTRLDHIFHNDQATPIRYEIISKLYDGFVSDHYGVIVEFVN